MATTTNYSWSTPDDTALVKDGAAAIRSLGTAIDTTVFNNAGAAIAKTIVDAKGDIIAGTAADTVARLAVGANNTILVADSTTATGLKWAAPAGGGKVLQVINATTTTATTNTTSTYADTTLTATITPTLATSKILVLTTQHIYFTGSSASDQAVLYRLMQGGTALATYTDSLAFNFVAGGGGMAGIQSLSWLDSPATTSATTYKTQFALNKTGTAYTQLGGYPAAITLLEIGA